MSNDGTDEGFPLSGIEALIAADARQAAAQLRERIATFPLEAPSYRLLARALARIEEQEGPTGELRTTVPDYQFGQAVQAIQQGNGGAAAAVLARRLCQKPDDADALRMMAHVARLEKFHDKEEALLRLAIELRPSFSAAWFDLAWALDQQKRHAESVDALDQIEDELATDPRVLYFRATALNRAARFDEGVALFEELVNRWPDRPEFWTSYGHSLMTVGRREEAVAAFRSALRLAPAMGVVWWSLSELKNQKFDRADIAEMETALGSGELTAFDRFHLHFALGKAFEDNGDPRQAFVHYAEGNRLRREEVSEARPQLSTYVADAERVFTPAFFEERRGSGVPAPGPIFILGMTRAGSTLVEQILSSHPAVEGTMELPDMLHLATQVSANLADYAERLAQLDRERLNAIGRTYLERTATYRKTERPYFTDKMPNNWLHVPLIHLALPNARIIDVRRHPMACCFSNFKQHFAVGQLFSYDQRELGEYYSAYVRFMSHIDEVLPGRVHRLFYEQLVDDSEAEIRRLLDHLELPFDESCLRFHESKRAVRTASSDQVRRPINRDSIDAWRAFEPWLTPLKEALGPVLDAYPDVPDFTSR